RPPARHPGRGAVFLAAGAAIGVGLFAIVCFSLTFLRVATLAEAQAAPPLFFPLIHFFAGAICEELIFRGVIFRLLEQAFGTLPSLLLSAALFGMAHVANPAASAIGAVTIGVESGVLLALAHRTTGTLWAPVGLHFGWNFAESVIFGMSVSGHPSSGLLRMQTSGPEVLPGGSAGRRLGLWRWGCVSRWPLSSSGLQGAVTGGSGCV
ncbi:MAG: CPBP family intramembrane metalloprotease, partial [Methanobacterium sp.]|nr:CPBP family intramembrane metalloprotease [Methanobacterium sp.]